MSFTSLDFESSASTDFTTWAGDIILNHLKIKINVKLIRNDQFIKKMLLTIENIQYSDDKSNKIRYND